MEFIDFLLEVVFEVWGFIFILMPLGMSPMAFLGFSSLGIFNTIVVHSGYDLFWFPDPYPHYLHHKEMKVNFSIGLLDFIFKTSK
jgi:sterol desaturase/sphingolipid hydroxylase (fatty acid hydroxylase superfamily)